MDRKADADRRGEVSRHALDRPPGRPGDRVNHLLLVEDNLGDIGLIREALANCHAEVELSVARDGLEALERLTGQTARVRPDLILLDLNLPRMDGRELLARIKTHPDLLRIPVVVFTSSSAPQDIAKAYDLHAACYLVKPPDLAGIEQVFALFNAFWLKTARLPGN